MPGCCEEVGKAIPADGEAVQEGPGDIEADAEDPETGAAEVEDPGDIEADLGGPEDGRAAPRPL